MKTSRLIVGAAISLMLSHAQAEERSPASADAPSDAIWTVHGQVTNVTQWHANFNAPFSGPNSLQQREPPKETLDITMFLGVRLWRGAELELDPEIDQGFGLSDTLGVAGYPSGESYKLGAAKPYLRYQRVLLRQSWPAASATAPAGDGLASGDLSDSRCVVTVGKFSIVDLFDTNPYAHDPKSDFLNWSIIDAGAFDYAGDAWGYTYGAAAEWQAAQWTTRVGYFAMSSHPGSTTIDAGFGQTSLVAELEHRHAWNGLDGLVKLLLFSDDGRMGRYQDAVAASQIDDSAPDTSAVRRFSHKRGWSLNVAQDLGHGLGVFARWSQNDGRTEAFDFTDIHRSLAVGGKVDGAAWGRAGDRVGLAFAINGLSREARAYFAAGGTGLLIGDGQLPNAGTERIVEAYYHFQVGPHVATALDVQRVVNPAYARDRGPVDIVGLRLHADF